jgi:hypothetical protein
MHARVSISNASHPEDVDFVASFPFRCKLDLKHAYHNLEVHPDDRKYTITIGAGRAVQWRKCVQGFASTGNFFQWAMETILVGVVFVLAAIYLDDLIIIGRTADECLKNVDFIMNILADYNFRVAFAKCQFTPSTSISFLGCQLDGLQVSPGPKVAVALGKVLPFYEQPTPKTQQKHLYSFLGLCAYLNNHKLGLRQALQPLYDIVAKTPFTFQDPHRICFDQCKAMLLELDSFWLPDHDKPLVMITDASGGTTGDGLLPSPGHWAAVLGQRCGEHDPSAPIIFNENFRLLQIQGGMFNDRQASWSVIEKEYFAIFQGFCRFDQFVRGRHVTLLTDSKVLLHAFRSSNQKVRRWYSFVQGFDFDVQHISSEQNALCDALTRCVSLAQLAPTPRSDVLALQTRPRYRRAPIQVPATPCPDPLISLLIDGDVEPNPGPPRAAPSTPPNNSNSDNDPIVSSPVTVALAPRRRRRISTPPQLSEPNPSQQMSSPERPQLQPDAPVHFSSSPSPPQSPEAFIVFSLVTPDIDSKPDSEAAASFALAFSKVLSLSTLSIPMTENELFMARKENIRESIVQFMIRNASARYDIFDGIPIRDCFRKNYLLPAERDRLHTSSGDVELTSWREYCQLLLLESTVLDPASIRVLALLFKTQIVLVRNSQYAVINPDDGHRRVFVRVFPNNALEWMCVADEAPPSDSPLRSLDILIDSNLLVFTHAPPQDTPPPLDPQEVPKSTHLELLHRFHCGFTGHPGAEATLAAMRSANVLWKGMTRDVKNFVRACPTCSLTRIKHRAALASAIPDLRLTDRPLSRWHIDHVDFPRCDHTHFKAICLFVDEVTGYTFLKGSRYKSALEVALSLMDLASFFGMPEYIHSDNGNEFTSDVMRQFQAISGLKRSFAIANNPNTNGIAERNVATAVRFVSSICIDFGRHNAWGLFLPLVMRAINSLPRKCLNGSSPNAFVFSSIHDDDNDVFPVTYAPITSAHECSVNTGPPSGTFAQRALYSQQVLSNAVCRYRDDLMQASLKKDIRQEPQVVSVGQQILIDWSGESHSARMGKTLPMYRGPYTVTAVHDNTLHLCHSQVPPPPHQPATLLWSRHARLYFCELDFDRSPSDPSASHVPLASASFGIECIISHRLRDDLPKSVIEAPGYSSQDVRNQYYEVRYYHSPFPAFQQRALRSYQDIAHTYAFDNYVVGNPSLHSHRPISSMPSTWDPRVVGRRSLGPLVPFGERDIVDYSTASD